MSQLLLLPPDMRKWLRDDHLALYVSDIVEQLDLSAILNARRTISERLRRYVVYPCLVDVW